LIKEQWPVCLIHNDNRKYPSKPRPVGAIACLWRRFPIPTSEFPVSPKGFPVC
jgi:hypothetical protein